MKYFDYFNSLETPVYVYHQELFEESASALSQAASRLNIHVHYAVKANQQSFILEHLAQLGFGAECVSAGELMKALASGMNPRKIGFSGVGKTNAEIAFAMDEEIGVFQVESYEELEVIQSLAQLRKIKVKVALRITPEIISKTHERISTGGSQHKFGFTQIEYDTFLANYRHFDAIECIGLHFHIGSQITDLKVFEELAQKASKELSFLENHLQKQLTYLNLGGGFGIDYEKTEIPNYTSWLSALREGLNAGDHVQVHVEPGRSLTAHCGVLLTKVLYTKPNDTSDFVVVDASMNNMMRTALYDAKHPLEVWPSDLARPTKKCVVVGGVCESTDVFGTYQLPKPKRNDWIIIRNTGAYGESMWLDYNGRERTRSIIAKRGVEELMLKLVRKRAKVV